MAGIKHWGRHYKPETKHILSLEQTWQTENMEKGLQGLQSIRKAGIGPARSGHVYATWRPCEKNRKMPSGWTIAHEFSVHYITTYLPNVTISFRFGISFSIFPYDPIWNSEMDTEPLITLGLVLRSQCPLNKDNKLATVSLRSWRSSEQ